MHESRLLPKNIDIAFERMKFVLDRQINGENCYEEQLKVSWNTLESNKKQFSEASNCEGREVEQEKSASEEGERKL